MEAVMRVTKERRSILRLDAPRYLMGATALFAQLQAGRIGGIVTDPQHAVVPGAEVTVTNTGTNIAQTIKTDASGTYLVSPLDPGSYTVSVSSPGFQTLIRNGIELTVGQSADGVLQLVRGVAPTRVGANPTPPI